MIVNGREDLEGEFSACSFFLLKYHRYITVSLNIRCDVWLKMSMYRVRSDIAPA